MAQFVGKPLPDFQVKPLAKGALGAKTSLKGLAAGRPLVRSRRVRPKTTRRSSSVALPPRAFSDIGRGSRAKRATTAVDGVASTASGWTRVGERPPGRARPQTQHTQVIHLYNGG